VSRIVLVRHCEPQEDARGLCYGRLDVGLSAAGRAHAVALAAQLCEALYTHVWTSPRLRARETAEPLARGMTVAIHDDLREIDFGELEGRSYDEIAGSDPELYRAWMETPTRVRFPGGESFSDLKRRAVAALEEIRARSDVALVVTHGGVIRAGLAAWLGMPDEAIFRLDVGYGRLTVVDEVEGHPLVRLVNGALAPPMTD
jgi:alpha-ribazole phosphatase